MLDDLTEDFNLHNQDFEVQIVGLQLARCLLIESIRVRNHRLKRSNSIAFYLASCLQTALKEFLSHFLISNQNFRKSRSSLRTCSDIRGLFTTFHVNVLYHPFA